MELAQWMELHLSQDQLMELERGLAHSLEAYVLPGVIAGQLAWLISWPLVVNTHYPHGMFLRDTFLKKRHLRFILDGGATFTSLYLAGWGLILISAAAFLCVDAFGWCSLLTYSLCALGQVCYRPHYSLYSL